MELNFNKINKLFEESKYSKRELAKKCGFTRPTLDGLLQGADVKISTLISLASFFKKPMSYFFDEEEVTDTNIEDSSSISKPLIVDSQDRLKPTDEQTLSIEYWEKVKKWDEKNSQSSEADQTDMEINIPADYPPEARHQIEKLNLEVNLLRKMIAKQDRFINYLLETKT